MANDFWVFLLVLALLTGLQGWIRIPYTMLISNVNEWQEKEEFENEKHWTIANICVIPLAWIFLALDLFVMFCLNGPGEPKIFSNHFWIFGLVIALILIAQLLVKVPFTEMISAFFHWQGNSNYKKDWAWELLNTLAIPLAWMFGLMEIYELYFK